MAMYVYSTQGEPVGFVMETFIHTMDGRPVGRIIGSRVHRLDGTYIGEWWKDMVVARPEGQKRDMMPIAPPPRRVSPGISFRRRVVLHGGYRDMFHLLAAEAASEPAEFSLAAE
jgi:hypothetical protein